MTAPYSVLFLCTGNSARSILAECITNRIGAGKFIAYSAGSMPRGQVHPQAIALLAGLGYETANLRSKPWDEFTTSSAPKIDFVVTVCDNAANEVCPIWPGKPVQAHWGIADPAADEGPAPVVALAFAEAYRLLANRIGLFASLPVESLDRLAMKRHMDEIGRTRDIPADA